MSPGGGSTTSIDLEAFASHLATGPGITELLDEMIDSVSLSEVLMMLMCPNHAAERTVPPLKDITEEWRLQDVELQALHDIMSVQATDGTIATVPTADIRELMSDVRQRNRHEANWEFPELLSDKDVWDAIYGGNNPFGDDYTDPRFQALVDEFYLRMGAPDGEDVEPDEFARLLAEFEAKVFDGLTPFEQSEWSLAAISDVLNTAREDKGKGIGEGGSADTTWSTNDLLAMIENADGYYTAEQVAHAQRVYDMVMSSPEARQRLKITESGEGFSWTTLGHLALDIFGMVPVVGNAADAINATWYAAEGEWLDAALSTIGLIPGIGQIAIAAKPAIKAAAAGMVFKNVDEALAWARRWLARNSDEAADLLRQADNADEVADAADVAATYGDEITTYDEFGQVLDVDQAKMFGADGVRNVPELRDPNIQDEMAAAWRESADQFTPREQGGWLVENADGTLSVERWPPGTSNGIRATEKPPNAVGAFHTHPNVANPGPSRKDIANVIAEPGLAPHFIVSQNGIYRIDVGGSWTLLD